jgi:predicted HTH transcriptional regulator
MKQLTIEQSKELLEAAEESLRMEFKASVDTSSESWLRDELVRAILAMSNTDTGGDIVIGVKESSDNVFLFEGVEQSHLEAFNVDDFKTLIESFSVSPVSFELYEAVLEENRRFRRFFSN